jgi:hypothetical protein
MSADAIWYDNDLQTNKEDPVFFANLHNIVDQLIT